MEENKPEESLPKKEIVDSNMISEMLENPAIAAMVKTPMGKKILMKQAIKMLRHSRPDLTDEQIKEVESIALGGDMEALEEKLVELGIFKS